MKSLKVSLVDDFELVMAGPERQERLQVRSPGYSRYYLSQFIFSQLGLMHLLAPYFPNQVETDFVVHPFFDYLIGKMYGSCGKNPPEFKTSEGSYSFGTFPITTGKKAVVAYSGGKDSMWNIWWMQERYGKENVLAVHIRGLNQGQQSQEDEYVRRQSRELGFQLEVLDLMNSSR